MNYLDRPTMLVIESFVLFLMGLLMFLAAFQERRDRTLLWIAAGMWLLCLGFMAGTVREYSGWFVLSITVTNVLFITAHACLWASLQAFRGWPTPWYWLAAGAVIWLMLCQWPPFLANINMRITVYSLLCLGYIGAGLAAVWTEWRRGFGAALLLIGLLTFHGMFYLYRIPAIRVQGVIWRNSQDFTPFILESLFLAISLSFGTLMMVRARAEQNFRHAAMHDILTGLLNRRALFERGRDLLSRLLMTRQDVTVLLCDLDWFKQVNDQFGHEAGDKVLAQFSQTLRQSVPKDNLCTRLGGEEFVVLAPKLGSREGLHLANRIRHNLTKQMGNNPCHPTVSIGVACSRDVGYNLDHLLAHADQALYAAKRAGRDCVRVWSAAVPEDAPSTRTTVSRA